MMQNIYSVQTKERKGWDFLLRFRAFYAEPVHVFKTIMYVKGWKYANVSASLFAEYRFV